MPSSITSSSSTGSSIKSWFARHCSPAPAWRDQQTCWCKDCFNKQMGNPKKPQASDWPYNHPTRNNNGFSSETASLNVESEAEAAAHNAGTLRDAGYRVRTNGAGKWGGP
ncbi:hypothetical protein NLG97_g7916 [Lecanicillium saksenae]|uniref:Uncharacterized protein n=1 Tax=Lecanicillium saksenae TaxID=468837 RepID=A0ACC1QLR8_9HYPO|nr:hypothetical protein NLG97_g7916 [Lecanicillium saksenae]